MKQNKNAEINTPSIPEIEQNDIKEIDMKTEELENMDQADKLLEEKISDTDTNRCD